MSHSAADGVAMVAAAKKTGRIVQIGSQRVSSVICAKAKELLANGIVGTLTLVEGTYGRNDPTGAWERSEEHTSELQSRLHLVCRLLLEKKKTPSFRLAPPARRPCPPS